LRSKEGLALKKEDAATLRYAEDYEKAFHRYPFIYPDASKGVADKQALERFKLSPKTK